MMMLNLDGGMGGGGATLNKDLAAQTNAGKNLFRTPFGDKTVFHTEDGGAVITTFIFDPDQPFNSSFNTASITTDYWGEIRKELTKQLLKPEDCKPLKPTKEETLWNHLRNAMPKEMLIQYFKDSPEQLKEYVSVLQKDAQLDYKEDEALTAAMQDRSFSFKYQIAIDAYPSQMDKNSSRRSTAELELPHGRKGVLTFYIQGLLKTDLEELKKQKKEEASAKKVKASPVDVSTNEPATKKVKNNDTSSSSSSSSSSSETKAAATDGLSTPAAKLSLRRVNTALPLKASRNNASMKEWRKLVQRLGLEEKMLGLEAVHQKEFATASEFFEAVDKWFAATLDSTATQIKLKESNNANQNMYN